MSKIFKARVNNSLDFEITSEDLSSLDAIKISDSEYHILQQNKSYKAAITACDFNQKTYTVSVNKNAYTIKIQNDLDLLIENMGFSSAIEKHIDFIMAPMPGLILDVLIKINHDVKENDPLLILEAMKMENVITSPRNGRIKSILIKKGDAVIKNQILIEFQ